MKRQLYRVIGQFQDSLQRKLIKPVTAEQSDGEVRFWPPEGQGVPQATIDRLFEAGCLAPAGEIAAKEAATMAKQAAEAAAKAKAKADAARADHQNAEEAAEAAAKFASEAEAIAEEAEAVAVKLAAEEATARQPMAKLGVKAIEELVTTIDDGDLLLSMLEEETENKARPGAIAALEGRLEEITDGGTE